MNCFYISGTQTSSKFSNERNALAELPAKSHKIALIKCSEKAGLQDYLTKVSPTKNLSKLNPFGR